MNVKNAICRGWETTARGAVEAWKKDSDEAEFACETDALIEAGLDYFRFLHEWCNDWWKLLFAKKVRNHQAAGTFVLDALTKAIDIGETMIECVGIAEERQYKVEKVADFRLAFHELKNLKDNMEARWPWLSEESACRGQADFEAGRFRPAGDVFDELQRPDSGRSTEAHS